jgi:hypothetical protein
MDGRVINIGGGTTSSSSGGSSVHTHYLKDLVEDSTHLLTTQSEKDLWNSHTKNKSDAHLLDRTNHTGTQSPTSIVWNANYRTVTDAQIQAWNSHTSLELGETATTAYRGDHGKISYTHSQSNHAPADATKNNTDTFLLNRENHTGKQPISTITNLQNILDTLEAKQLLRVDTFADLPDASTHTDSVVIVDETTGVIGFRKLAGLYKSDGTTWNRLSKNQLKAYDSDMLNGKKASFYATADDLANHTHDTSHTHNASELIQDDTHKLVTLAQINTWNSNTSLSIGITSSDAFRGDHGKVAHDHATSDHAPVDATKNNTDSYLLNRTNHTGTQAISTITDLQNILNGKASTTHTHADYLTLESIKKQMLKDGTSLELDNRDIILTKADGSQDIINLPTGVTDTWRDITSIPQVDENEISVSSHWAYEWVKTKVPLNAKFTDTVYNKPSSEPISYIEGLEKKLTDLSNAIPAETLPNKSYVQTHTTQVNIDSGNVDVINLFDTVTIQKNKKIRIDYFVPYKFDTSLVNPKANYINININIKINDTWYNLGNTIAQENIIYSDVKNTGNFLNFLTIDPIAILGLDASSSYTVQIELTARCETGTAKINYNNDINKLDNNLGARGDLLTDVSNQQYCHVMIEEKTR